MRILWLAPEPPVPPLTGGRERARRMIEYLAGRHQLHLVTLAEDADRPALQDLAAGLDALSAVPFQPRQQDNRAALQGGLTVAAADWRPDQLHVQGLETWPWPPRPEPHVLDLHDILTVLDERFWSWRPRRRSTLAYWGLEWSHWWMRRGLKRLERQAVRAARAIIVTCAEDARALEHYDPSLPGVTVLPNGVQPQEWHLPAAEIDGPTILFPGALNWRPNICAARVLIREVLPLVQALLPETRLVVAGRRPDPALVGLAAANPAVTLLADPADIRPIFAQATLIAVPLRVATGTRLKILQALAAGRPVVSTPVGAAGLDLVPGRDLIIAPLVEPFAKEVVRLLADESARERLAEAGRRAVEGYRWPSLLPALDAVYPPDGGE